MALFFYNLGICVIGKPWGKCKGCGESYITGGSKVFLPFSDHMLKCKALEKLKQTKLLEIMLDNLGKLNKMFLEINWL